MGDNTTLTGKRGEKAQEAKGKFLAEMLESNDKNRTHIPNAPKENISTQLAKNQNGAVRQLAAENHATSNELLPQLAENVNWTVRQSVAENHNTPGEVLVKLARDSEWSVRAGAAGNPNIPYLGRG